MNTLTIVFTGLVFYASPQGAEFTNAVLVAGNDPQHHHTSKLTLPRDGSVTVMTGGAPTDAREWTLGPRSWIIVNGGTKTPGRSDAFREHVPSLGQALMSAFPTDAKKRGALHPCTYAKMSNEPCASQQGRVQLSGGTLDAVIPAPDPLYTFVTDSLQGGHKSRLTHESRWTSHGEVKSFDLHHDGKTFTILVNRDAKVVVTNEPSHGTGRHIGIMRALYGLDNNGSEADFPRPVKDRDALGVFQSLAVERDFPKNWFVELLRVSNPVLCPPATQ